MLSIGKMGNGQHGYYLDKIARGAEDYYLGNGEAEGRWLGGGATALGLHGTVDADHFTQLLTGHGPDGAKLGRKVDTPGFDLTFSAPKSVSVLWGLGDDHLSSRVRDAHEAAIDQAMAYLERVASFGRRGAGGTQQIETAGFAAAAFRHRTSRLGDPQLHTHVVVANKVLGADGQWSALHGTLLYHQAKAAGTLYQAALRHELRDLGLEWTVHENGTADLDCVPERVRDAFSQRRAQIEAEMEARGITSRAGAQTVTLATRPAKLGTAEDGIALEWDWLQRAAALGYGLEDIRAAVAAGQARVAEVDTAARTSGELDSAAEVALSSVGLTERASTFAEKDVLQALAARVQNGADIGQVEAAAAAVLARGEVVRVDTAAAPSPASVSRLSLSHRHRPGAWVPIGADVTRYTTAELLEVEARLLADATEDADTGAGTVAPELVADALAAYPRVASTDEQAAMVRTLTGSGRVVDVVNAPGGSGKTTSLAAATAAWQAAGRHVVGATLSAQAAGVLGDETGMQASTIASLRMDLARYGGLAPGSVLVVDEAGQVGSRDLQHLLEHVRAADAKLVLVGDTRQLPEIDAGGAFRGLVDRLEGVVLRRNRRQVDEDERARLRQLRAGDVSEAIRSYDAAGRITRAATAEDLRRLLVVDWSAQWLADGGLGHRTSRVMLALTRADAEGLNDQARAILDEAGELSGPELATARGRGFRVGDHVVTRQNDYRRGVLNGHRWVVAGVDCDAGTVEVARVAGERLGRRVTLPADYVAAGHLEHGYAVTVSVSQGSTVDRAWVLGSDATYREAGYVAASRAREITQWYVTDAPAAALGVDRCCEHGPGCHGDHPEQQALPVDVRPDGRDAVEGLTAALSRSRWEPMATDTTQPEQPGWRHLGDDDPADMDAAALRGEIAALRQVLARRDQPADVSDALAAARRELGRAQGEVAAAEADLSAADEALEAAAATRVGLRRRPDPEAVAAAEARARLAQTRASSWTGQVARLEGEIAELGEAGEARAAWEQANRPWLRRLERLEAALGPAEAAEVAARAVEPVQQQVDAGLDL